MSNRNKLNNASRPIKLGLFGFGCVGQGLHQVLIETNGVDAQIKKICIKDGSKTRILPSEIFTTNPDDILNDPEIDVVVELIDDAQDAFEIVSTALKNKKVKKVVLFYEDNSFEEYNL